MSLINKYYMSSQKKQQVTDGLKNYSVVVVKGKKYINCVWLASLREGNVTKGKNNGSTVKKMNLIHDIHAFFTTMFTYIPENHEQPQEEYEDEEDENGTRILSIKDRVQKTFIHTELLTLEILTDGRITLCAFTSFMETGPILMKFVYDGTSNDNNKFDKYDSFCPMTLTDGQFHFVIESLVEKTTDVGFTNIKERPIKSPKFPLLTTIFNSMTCSGCCPSWMFEMRDVCFCIDTSGEYFFCSQLIGTAIIEGTYIPLHDGEEKCLNDEMVPERIYKLVVSAETEKHGRHPMVITDFGNIKSLILSLQYNL